MLVSTDWSVVVVSIASTNSGTSRYAAAYLTGSARVGRLAYQSSCRSDIFSSGWCWLCLKTLYGLRCRHPWCRWKGLQHSLRRWCRGLTHVPQQKPSNSPGTAGSQLSKSRYSPMGHYFWHWRCTRLLFLVLVDMAMPNHRFGEIITDTCVQTSGSTKCPDCYSSLSVHFGSQ